MPLLVKGLLKRKHVSMRFFPYINYQDSLLFFFLTGVICGTAAAYLLQEDIGQRSGYFLQLFMQNISLGIEERRGLFFKVAGQRVIEVFIGWLAGMVTFSRGIFIGISVVFGMTWGIIVSVITYEKGILGLPVFLCSLLPQYLFYLPVWWILGIWGEGNRRSKRIFPLILLLLLVIFGAAAETCINPFFLKMVL